MSCLDISVQKQIDLAHDVTAYESYTFRNNYFWVGCDNKTEDNKSYMFRYTHRQATTPVKYLEKSFIDPRRCLSVFNHFCRYNFSFLEQIPVSEYRILFVSYSFLVLCNRKYSHAGNFCKYREICENFLLVNITWMK